MLAFMVCMYSAQLLYSDVKTEHEKWPSRTAPVEKATRG